MKIPSFLCCIILPFMACVTLPYFFTLSHKWHDFGGEKKGIENKMCVLSFPITFV
jgi:hypothetical protein